MDGSADGWMDGLALGMTPFRQTRPVGKNRIWYLAYVSDKPDTWNIYVELGSKPTISKIPVGIGKMMTILDGRIPVRSVSPSSASLSPTKDLARCVQFEQ
jgi:hypothetical protein